jgi:hypothetical protein
VMDNRFGEERERHNLVSEFTCGSSVRPRPFNPWRDDGSSQLQPLDSETDSVSLIETKGWQDNSSDLWTRECSTGISPERQPRILLRATAPVLDPTEGLLPGFDFLQLWVLWATSAEMFARLVAMQA